MPYSGFTGPIPSLNRTTVAYPGSFHYRFGKRKPQSYTYSPHYPVLQYNTTQANFYGGNFWDLRATGYKLMSPDSEQAQGPVVDTQEMGFPDFACVVFRLSKAVYRPCSKLFGAPSLLRSAGRRIPRGSVAPRAERPCLATNLPPLT
jgi:cytochrome c peroxidase